jgi:mono/diheme cytochrome c family protein
MMRNVLRSVLAAMSCLALGEAAASPQVAEGRRLYLEACAVCHGEDGRAGAGYQTPIWGAGAKIARFETAMGLFEYNQMMMPFDDPTRLSDAEKWAIVAFLLDSHGALQGAAEVSPGNAASIPIR